MLKQKSPSAVLQLTLTAPFQEKFVNRLERMIKRCNKVELHTDSGWYSEHEMKTVLHWSASET